MRNFKNYLIGGMVLIALILVALVYFSVKSTKKTAAEKKSNVELIDPSSEKPENLVGNDKDEHGCIASAGYTWSELLQECIRPFEKGIKLLSGDEDGRKMGNSFQ